MNSGFLVSTQHLVTRPGLCCPGNMSSGAEEPALGLAQAAGGFVFQSWPLPALWYFGVTQPICQMTLFTCGLRASLEILFSRMKDA